MTSPAQLRAHRADVAQLTQFAFSELSRIWRRLKTAAEARDVLLDVMPALIDKYGNAAVALGADWYDEIREQEQARGRFRAIPVDLPDLGRAEALVRWGVGPLFAQDVAFDISYSLIAGGFQRIIADASRKTVARSAIADPAADGWQRVGFGEDCPFCTMLIARGAVYEDATADFSSHDNCNCAAVPAFGGRERPVKPYTPSSRRISDADRARVREYLRTK